MKKTTKNRRMIGFQTNYKLKTNTMKISEKTCVACNRTLAIDEFYKSSKAKDGLQGHCKECHRKAVKSSQERREALGAARKTRSANNPDLEAFTSRQLLTELKARGYRGELTITQTVNIEKL